MFPGRTSKTIEHTPSRRTRNVAHRLLAAMSTPGRDTLDVPRARDIAGARVSAITCGQALQHLEELGAVVQTAPGIWRRTEGWRGIQADWYA